MRHSSMCFERSRGCSSNLETPRHSAPSSKRLQILVAMQGGNSEHVSVEWLKRTTVWIGLQIDWQRFFLSRPAHRSGPPNDRGSPSNRPAVDVPVRCE